MTRMITPRELVLKELGKMTKTKTQVLSAEDRIKQNIANRKAKVLIEVPEVTKVTKVPSFKSMINSTNLSDDKLYAIKRITQIVYNTKSNLTIDEAVELSRKLPYSWGTVSIVATYVDAIVSKSTRKKRYIPSYDPIIVKELDRLSA